MPANAQVQVTLSTQGSGFTIADGIRLLPQADVLNTLPVATLTWHITAEHSGEHHIATRWTAHANRSQQATYRITHEQGYQDVVVNQTQNGGQWHTLANVTVTWQQGQSYRIELRAASDGYTIADALQITPPDSTDGNNDNSNPTQTAKAGGCTTYTTITSAPRK